MVFVEHNCWKSSPGSICHRPWTCSSHHPASSKSKIFYSDSIISSIKLEIYFEAGISSNKLFLIEKEDDFLTSLHNFIKMKNYNSNDISNKRIFITMPKFKKTTAMRNFY